MHQPDANVSHYINTWKTLVEIFGDKKADEIWSHTIYYTFTDKRDFFNVLNEHPDVLAHCETVTKANSDIYKDNKRYMIGNIWGVPYPEDINER